VRKREGEKEGESERGVETKGERGREREWERVRKREGEGLSLVGSVSRLSMLGERARTNKGWRD
jgi:hypothetical protein